MPTLPRLFLRRKYLLLHLLLLSVYLVSELALVTFNGSPARTHWQFLDLGLLKDDLLESLYLLHAQPPLMNLLLGLALKIGDGHHRMTLYVLQMALVVANGFMLSRICQRFALPRFVTWIVFLSPSFYLYSNWFFETFYTFTFMNMVLLGISEFNRRQGCIFFLAGLGLLSSTHALFHPLLVLLFALGTFFFIEKHLTLLYDRPYFMTVMTAALLIPFLVVIKNYTVFGVPTTSSWLGCNLSQVTVHTEDRFNAFAPFDDNIEIGTKDALNTPTRECCNNPNFNYFGMLLRCDALQYSSIHWIGEHSKEYVKNILATLRTQLEERGYNYAFISSEWTTLGKTYFGLFEEAIAPVDFILPLFILVAPLLAMMTLWFEKARSPRAFMLIPMVALYYVHLLLINALNGAEQVRLNFRFYFFIVFCTALFLRTLVRQYLHLRRT
ncbi:MAG: hypothetical protein EB060_02395 [Proteobacteria bacterium]|nr:hypothetical protein [Pseudomonadota bacterium]